MSKFLMTVGIFLCIINGVYAQTGFSDKDSLSCGSSGAMKSFLKSNPKYENLDAQIEQQLQSFRNSNAPSTESTITLPVVVHIIHNNGPENISDARVLAGIQHLNQAFANSGYYDQNNGVNTNIQFCLAQRDPNNNLTNGITRNMSSFTNMGGPLFYSDDLNVKNLNRWNPQCYINIWLVNDIPGSVAGYAFLPSAHGSNVDGIVEEASFFGSTYQKDVVITHEMGHYLGLYHTFEQGCNNSNCAIDGDRVCDTPPDNSTASTSCNVPVNSCSTDVLSGFTTDQNDLTTAYMDYGNWNCMSVFTQGQTDRMNWFITNVRGSLLNCLSCTNPCPSPVTASFTSSMQTGPTGSTISFTNNSINGAGYTWYVNGAVVSTSLNYSQQFIQQGTYIIKLLAVSSNPAQCISSERTDTIVITCPVSAAFTPAYNGVTTLGSSVTFTNSSANATSYQWYYDNVLAGTSSNYTATFNSLGTHYIKLRSISQYCIDSFQVYYVVNPDNLTGSNISFQKHFEIDTSLTQILFSHTGLLTQNEDIIVGSHFYNSVRNWVTRFTKTGEVVWSKSYDQDYFHQITASLNTNDGNHILAGDKNGFGPFVLKIDGDGNVIWSTTPYSNLSFTSHTLNDIIQLSDNSLILSSTMVISGTSNLYLSKLTSSGTLLWSKRLPGQKTEGGQMLLAGNGVYVAGNFLPQTSANWDGLLIKIDPATGNLLFAKRYDAGGVSNKFVNISMLGSKIILNGYILAPPGEISIIKTLDLVDLSGGIISSKKIQHANANASDPGQLINNSNQFFLAVNDITSGRTYLDKFDSTLSFLLGKVYLNNTNLVTITNIFQITGGSVILTGKRGMNHTVMIRTLPDLSTPGCNDSSFLPLIQPNPLSVLDITTSVSFAADAVNSLVLPFVATNRPAVIYNICQYIPNDATCDSAMIQNYYVLNNGGIGGSPVEVKATCRRLNKNILTSFNSSFPETVLMETDEFGNRISNRKFPGLENIAEIKNTPDNGYLLLGTKSSGPNFYLIKFDVNSNVLWTKEYSFPSEFSVRGSRLFVFSDYLIVCAGKYLFKLDASGNFIFGKNYISSSIIAISSVIEDGPNLVISISRYGGLFKIDKITGNQLWAVEGQPANVIKSGNFYITTEHHEDTLGRIHKYGVNGNLLASKYLYIQGSGFTTHKTISAGNPGAFVIMNNKKNYSEYINNDMYLTYIDSSLNVIAGVKTNVPFTVNGRDLVTDNAGYLYPAGDLKKTDVFFITNNYAFLYKTKLSNLNSNCVFTSTSPSLIVAPPPFPGITLPYAMPVSLTSVNVSSALAPVNIFTTRFCITENCITAQPCNTTGCTVFDLTGPNQICRLTDTIIFNLAKTPGCVLTTSWIITGSATNTILLQNDSTLKLLSSATGTLKVVAKSITACRIFEDSVSLNVFNSPSSLNLGPDLQICPGSVTTLRAGPGFAQYEWQDYSTDSTFTAYLPGIYFVKATNACGIIFRDTVSITGIPAPPFDLGPDKTICNLDSVTLTAPTGFSNYNWAPSYNINNIHIPTVKVWPGVDTIYTVTALVNGSCLVIDSIRVTVRTATPINLGADTSFCSGGSKLLSAGSGFTSYQWSTGATSPSITVTTAGTYWIAATNSSGCISRDTISVLNVYPTPAINIGADTSICTGTGLQLNAGPGFTSYLWQDGSANPTYSANTVGLYWVQVTNSNNCVKRDSISILNVFPSAAISLGADTSLCSGGSKVLSAGPGFTSYQWSTGAISPSITVSTPGTFRIAATNPGGCISRDTLSILNVYPSPVINVGADTSICSGTSLQLNAGSGFTSYLWQDGSANPTYSANAVGLYWVQVRNSNNCVKRDSISILNVFSATPFSLGADTSFCEGQSLILTPGPGFNNYIWQNNSTLPTFTATTPGTYWVEATNQFSCKSGDTLNVISLYPKPPVDLISPQSLCKGTGFLLDAGPGYAAYLWHDGSTTRYLNATTVGQYKVTVTNSMGCRNADSIRITAVLDTPKNFIAPVISLCSPNKIFVKTQRSFSSYLWSTGSNADSILLTQGGNYSVRVTNAVGCPGKENFQIKISECLTGIYFPNSFTPNNDNLNDVFKPKIFSDFDEYKMDIYNRYGQKIYTSDNPYSGWDGTFKGIEQNVGVYIWIASYKLKSLPKTTQKGTVLLIR